MPCFATTPWLGRLPRPLVAIGADGASLPSNTLLQGAEVAASALAQPKREPRNTLLQGEQVRATPLVRRLAQELGIDPAVNARF
jgi:pyruvate/2-oxoglutarate dehydrogenase complex dihydrolipoamide acyltransferase (E2) component